MTINIALATEQEQRLCNGLAAVKKPTDVEFNALSFELKHSEDFQKSQNDYIACEVDSVKEDFGELFRVWNGKTLLGTFYKISLGWKATPFYLCRQYVKAEVDLSKTLDTSDSAVSYLKQMYEGASRNGYPVAA